MTATLSAYDARMEVIVFAILLVVAIAAAARWGVDSRPRVDEHDRWWPGVR